VQPCKKAVIGICVTVGISLVSAIATAPAAIAAQTVAPWMEPAVVQAASNIGMNEQQQLQFRASLEEYLTERFATIRRISRSNNPDPERRIKRSLKKLAETMDAQMREVLSSEQQPRWELYLGLLLAELAG